MCRPGDTLNFGEDEYSALSAKLNEKLSPNGVHNSWEIEPECVGVWYRPNFDNLVVFFRLKNLGNYPYLIYLFYYILFYSFSIHIFLLMFYDQKSASHSFLLDFLQIVTLHQSINQQFIP